jgi:hypothetical protein
MGRLFAMSSCLILQGTADVRDKGKDARRNESRILRLFLLRTKKHISLSLSQRRNVRWAFLHLSRRSMGAQALNRGIPVFGLWDGVKGESKRNHDLQPSVQF